MANAVYLNQAGLSHYDEKALARQTNAIADALTTAKAYTDTLENGAVKTNTDAITKLDGDATVEGSVKAQINTVKTTLETEIEAAKYDDTTIKASVAANTSAITKLNGDSTVEGSVAKQVADAVTKIVADAPEAYDTLKEISDWITNHEDSASSMNTAIQKNKTDIANLVKLVGSLPEGTAATTIVEYIDSKVGDVDFSEAIATAKSEAISEAKTYSDGLAKNYATAAQGVKADSAVQTVATGSTNGTVAVDGTDVAVKGLGSAAYELKSAFEVAGAAKALEDGQVATNKSDIATLQTKVAALEEDTFTAITNEQIDALFTTA